MTLAHFPLSARVHRGLHLISPMYRRHLSMILSRHLGLWEPRITESTSGAELFDPSLPTALPAIFSAVLLWTNRVSCGMRRESAVRGEDSVGIIQHLPPTSNGRTSTWPAIPSCSPMTITGWASDQTIAYG